MTNITASNMESKQ